MRTSAPVITAVLLAAALGSPAACADKASRPNVVVIFCDDLGYGDLACFGHPTIATPHLDRMAREGQKWTNFYAAAPVCTPSRAAILTGRLPIRTGMCSDTRRVLFPDSAGGLQPEEVTIADALKSAGYATACVGKWHLGHLPQYLPTEQGFDSYFGIPYSNDMDRLADSPKGREAFLNPKPEYFNVPLLRNKDEIERPADQYTITRRYTEEAVRFITAERTKPFFLYLAHNMPHVPLFSSPNFHDTSLRGLYGDVIEEIDWSVGQVLDALRRSSQAKNTLVLFTSDNGPWLIFDEQGGSAGLLRDGKGSTWEGGMREPTLFWWPGTIRPGVVRQIGSTLDMLPTCTGWPERNCPQMSSSTATILPRPSLAPVTRRAAKCSSIATRNSTRCEKARSNCTSPPSRATTTSRWSWTSRPSTTWSTTLRKSTMSPAATPTWLPN